MPARAQVFRRHWPGLALAVLFLSLAGAGPARAAQDAPPAPVETGPAYRDVTVIYRERMALPPDAVLLVRLYERPDASSGKRALVSELRLPTEGRNVPLPFRISWPAGTPPSAAQGPRYELEAQILGPDGPLFTTADPVVLPPDAGGPPLVLMTYRVISKGGGAPGAPAATGAALASPPPATPPAGSTPPAVPAGPASPVRADAPDRTDVPGADRSSAALAPLPALYAGEGGTPSLYLAPDHSYILTRRRAGSAPDVESGRWHVLERGAVLQLAGGGAAGNGRTSIGKAGETAAKSRLTRIPLAPEAPSILAFPQGGPVLRRTGPAGSTHPTNPADPANPANRAETPEGAATARTAEGIAPPADTRPFIGQFRSTDAGATLRECGSGAVYTVNKGRAFRLLEEIYLSKRRDPGAELLADVDAHILPRAGEAGQAIAIDAFRSLESRACPGEDRSTPRQLAGRRWRLVELYGRPAEVYPDQPEPHLAFAPTAPNKGRLSGSDGCNAIVGQYLRDGGALRFLGLGATMKLCPEGAAQSREFARALAETDAWLLSGAVLELFGKGRLLATFEAVAL